MTKPKPKSEHKRRGRRPIEGVKLTPHTITLPDAAWDAAERLGGGNRSRGVRVALEKAHE